MKSSFLSRSVGLEKRSDAKAVFFDERGELVLPGSRLELCPDFVVECGHMRSCSFQG